MKIVQTRRISQIFFLLLFIWFCIVSTVGSKIWQLRGWPVNWFLQLDPLVAIGTILTTHKFYLPLLWALATIIITIIFGRFFCSWLCPFGTIHHFAGYLAKRKKTTAEKIRLNKYRPAQCIKYIILVFLLAMALFPSLAVSLQTGLFDPIPLVTRSVNLVIISIANRAGNFISVPSRFYEGAWIVFAFLFAALLANIFIPRFYCRFICPLGAFFGLIDRFAIWRIGKKSNECKDCHLCEVNCEGGCEPTQKIRISECVLCFNCINDCRHDLVTYQTKTSAAGEITNPDISRRGFVLSLTGGLIALPAIRLSNKLGSNFSNSTIRPPGALAEEEFLKRCIKCSQCMRICPTNVIQPASIEGGLENLWTPILNNRIGSSGCQYNCVACSQVCPTAAIRPINLDEKHGLNEFQSEGPIKLGTAFVDRNRCLPWAMDKPCIVCQENCPVSPKAIYTKDVFEIVRDGLLNIKNISGKRIEIEQKIEKDRFATGDYYCQINDAGMKQITANTEKIIEISEEFEQNIPPGTIIAVKVKLKRPFVDITKCIGCGICEHECPVSGKRAIRVSAEGESRSNNRRLLL